MNKLWNYNDYVKHLSNENRIVRRWALDALANHYPNRYTDKVSDLINDEDEHLVCSALRYLVQHEAVQHAPAIVEIFKTRQGLIPGNCAGALAKMYYEPAIDVMLEYFINPGSTETFLGILEYLGTIRHEKCRDALIAAVKQIKDSFIQGSAMAHLLRHFNPEDATFALDKYFESADRDKPNDLFLKNISSAIGGGSYFRDLTAFSQNDIWVNPAEAIDTLSLQNPHIQIDEAMQRRIVKALEKGQYDNFISMIMFDARNIFNERYPKDNCPEFLSEIFDQDTICVHILEDLSKRSVLWSQIKHDTSLGSSLVSLVMSIYFAVKEREVYPKALHPEANTKDLMRALKDTGSVLPKQIQKKIKQLSPISELKANLSKDLLTWGDIWTVKIMGQIGDKSFVPGLIRVVSSADNMDYIYSDALWALSALDESADESILSAIGNRELDDWESFPILQYLSYSEAYDLALQRWENENDDDMDSYEVFSSCLRGIGDRRGIEKLQDIYANENNASYIGDSLECLGELHEVNIPELPDIVQARRKRNEQLKAREKELNQLAGSYREEKKREAIGSKENMVPFKRDTPKVGRNDPCPCGSGKKYKKCCLK